MLDENLLQKEESIVKQTLPEKKKGKFGLILKIIFILVIIGLVLYFFMNPESIRNVVNRFFGDLLK